MGDIAVHEFISLDGVFEDPSWTFDYGFLPKMGDAMGAITDAVHGDPAGPHDVRDVRAGLVDPHGRGRPGRAVLQRHPQVRRRRDRAERGLGAVHADSARTTPTRSAG